MAFKGTAHDLALDGSMKAYKEKAFFTDPYIFCHDSCEWRIDLELGGWEVGVKKWPGEPLVGGLKKNLGDESGITLWLMMTITKLHDLNIMMVLTKKICWWLQSMCYNDYSKGDHWYKCNCAVTYHEHDPLHLCQTKNKINTKINSEVRDCLQILVKT